MYEVCSEPFWSFVDEVMIVGGCHKSRYGCCMDGITPAGPDFGGCPFDGSEQDCKESEFGCCIDGVTPASGPFGYVLSTAFVTS